jgi:hypothetical protein
MALKFQGSAPVAQSQGKEGGLAPASRLGAIQQSQVFGGAKFPERLRVCNGQRGQAHLPYPETAQQALASKLESHSFRQISNLKAGSSGTGKAYSSSEGKPSFSAMAMPTLQWQCQVFRTMTNEKFQMENGKSVSKRNQTKRGTGIAHSPSTLLTLPASKLERGFLR